MIVDEPTAGLDPRTETLMMMLFRQLANQGSTIVITDGPVTDTAHLEGDDENGSFPTNAFERANGRVNLYLMPFSGVTAELNLWAFAGKRGVLTAGTLRSRLGSSPRRADVMVVTFAWIMPM